MRLIFEKDIEHCDFMELILTQDDFEKIELYGIVCEFEEGLGSKKNLNIMIRLGKGE